MVNLLFMFLTAGSKLFDLANNIFAWYKERKQIKTIEKQNAEAAKIPLSRADLEKTLENGEL